MTLNEMTEALDAHFAEEDGNRFFCDYVSAFDMSDDEAERAAEEANTAEEFIRIWENTDWWRDQ